MNRNYDPHLEYMSERGMQVDDETYFKPDPPQYEKCYMCVPVEHRMDEQAARAAGHPWPLRLVVRKFVTNRADPTEVVALSCGHSII